VLNVDLNGVEIDDLQNIAELGSYICGNYDSTDNGGHRNQNFPLQRGFTGTEVHALSFVSSSGNVENLHIHNIVSARGDALAMQFFPGNRVTIGANIKIEDIHAGAALSKDVLGALDNSMPNKVPRACAITVWTWTDEEQEFYPNEIEFTDRDAIDARCLTTHTVCDDSEYDGEALANIAPCTAQTIVKGNMQNMANELVYEQYIRHISPAHQKLFAILDAHPEPDFYPPRAFPERYASSTMNMYVVVVVAAVVAVLAMALAVAHCQRRRKVQKYVEYEPLPATKQRISLS